MSKFKNEIVEAYLTVKVVEKPVFVGKTVEGASLFKVTVLYRGQRSRKSKINLVYSSELGVNFEVDGFYNINTDVRTRLQYDKNKRKFSEVYLYLIDTKKLETEPDDERWYNRVKFENLTIVCTPYTRKAYNDENADICVMTIKRRKTNSVNYFYPVQGWYEMAKQMGTYADGDTINGFGNLQGHFAESKGVQKTEINISKLV